MLAGSFLKVFIVTAIVIEQSSSEKVKILIEFGVGSMGSILFTLMIGLDITLKKLAKFAYYIAKFTIAEIQFNYFQCFNSSNFMSKDSYWSYVWKKLKGILTYSIIAVPSFSS